MKIEKIIVFETVTDHLTGEEMGNALCSLNEMPQVLDAAFFSGIGKKNRPVYLWQILCREEHMEQVRDAIFRHTHALGLRYRRTERFVLRRTPACAMVDGIALPAKAHMVENCEYIRPESDAVADLALSRHIGMPALRFAKKS